MDEHVHVLTPSLDHERFSRPLNRDEPPADRVHLVEPPEDHPFPTLAGEKLVESLEQFDIHVESKTVDPTPFPSAVRELYDLLHSELSQDNKVYVNVSGGAHQLSSAVTIAASYLVSDTVFGPDVAKAPAIDNDRSNVYFYSTEPSEYYFTELVTAHDAIEEALQPERVSSLQENANELADRVQRDRDTVRRLNMLLNADLDAISDRFGVSDDPELAEALESLEKLIEGVTTTVEAMNELEQNKEPIEEMFSLFGLDEPVKGVLDLMEDIKENDEPVQSTDLFNYFENRLDTINQIVSDAQALENSRPAPLADDSDGQNVFEVIQDKGVAGGVREFDEATSLELDPPISHLEQPGPLQINLRPTERALLYTLWKVDSANSIQQFTQQVLYQAVRNTSITGVELPDTDDAEELQAVPESDEYASELASSIQSTVQYNLTQLDKKGFVRRVRGEGRKKEIKFTRGGKIYAETREFDEQWRNHAFKDLVESIEKSL